jgi:hypothetical protein
MATYPLPHPPFEAFILPQTMIHLLPKKIEYYIRSKLRRIRLGTIFASTLVGNEVGKAINGFFAGGTRGWKFCGSS